MTDQKREQEIRKWVVSEGRYLPAGPAVVFLLSQLDQARAESLAKDVEIARLKASCLKFQKTTTAEIRSTIREWLDEKDGAP